MASDDIDLPFTDDRLANRFRVRYLPCRKIEGVKNIGLLEDGRNRGIHILSAAHLGLVRLKRPAGERNDPTLTVPDREHQPSRKRGVPASILIQWRLQHTGDLKFTGGETMLLRPSKHGIRTLRSVAYLKFLCNFI